MKFNNARMKNAVLQGFAIASLLMMESANAATDIFDNLSRISGKLAIVKTIVIYVVFLIGLCILAWGIMECVKISKPENRGEATWTGILIKCAAGAIMIALTAFSDTMQMTIFNTTQAAPSNISMVIEPLKVDLSKLG